jgi:hypothetical protein
MRGKGGQRELLPDTEAVRRLPRRPGPRRRFGVHGRGLSVRAVPEVRGRETQAGQDRRAQAQPLPLRPVL